MKGGGALHVRPAEAGDLERLRALWRQVDALHAQIRPDFFAKGSQGRRSHEYLGAVLADPNQDLLVAARGGDVVGLVHLQLYDTPPSPLFASRRRAHVEDLVVDGDHRRRGIGTALLAAAERWARGKNAQQVVLTVWSGNDPGLAFYEAQHFATVSRVLAKELR